MLLADWEKVPFPLLAFEGNVTALAVGCTKNRHITAQPGGKRKMAKYIVDDIAFRDTMWKLYASSDSVRVALQALIKIGERIEDNASE